MLGLFNIYATVWANYLMSLCLRVLIHKIKMIISSSQCCYKNYTRWCLKSYKYSETHGMNYMVFKFKFTLNYFYLLYKCCTKERSRVAVYVLRHYLLVSSDCSVGSNTTADTTQKQTGDERASLQLKSKQNILQLFICTE